MTVLLVNTPFWKLYYGPPITLPTLAGYLQSQGIRCEQFDASIAMLNHFVARRACGELTDLLGRRFDKQRTSLVLDAREQAFMLECLARLPHLRQLTKDPSFVPRTLRSSTEFYSHGRFQEASSRLSTLVWALEEAGISRWLRHARVTWADMPALLPRAGSRQDCVTETFRDLLEARLASNPAVVGFTCATKDQLMFALYGCQLVKALLPSAVTTIGGYFITAESDGLLHKDATALFDYVEFFVVGEGEQSLASMDAVQRGEVEIGEIPNVIYRKDGRIRKNAVRRFEKSQVSRPDYSQVRFSEYFAPQPVVNVQASRGCYWNKCTFCDAASTYSAYVAKKAEAFVDEIESIIRTTNARHFFLNDEAVAPSVLRAFAAELVRRRLEIHWTAEARLEKSITRSDLELIRASGCLKLMFGVESASQRMLDAMDKGVSVTEMDRILREAHDAGIVLRIFCIGGFPGEKAEELEATKAFVAGLPQRYGCHVSMTKFRLYHKSILAKNPSNAIVIVRNARRALGEELDYTETSDPTRATAGGVDLGAFEDLPWPACGGENLLYLSRVASLRALRATELDRLMLPKASSLEMSDAFVVVSGIVFRTPSGYEGGISLGLRELHAVRDGGLWAIKIRNFEEVQIDWPSAVVLSALGSRPKSLGRVIAEARRQQIDSSQVAQAIANLLCTRVLRRTSRLDALLEA
ncbi:B12-binding domain-containing radical SAM protein [Paraburkholderia mimosarum]|uniref:B12-binding domain-containing radical SAM protein n=1 Tax=Paraburkholderia mimosarum TaxID=312026 RepID=UPI0003F8A5B9|nr:radical SAM protein [Paraburkholderia mimosarum]